MNCGSRKQLIHNFFVNFSTTWRQRFGQNDCLPVAQYISSKLAKFYYIKISWEALASTSRRTACIMRHKSTSMCAFPTFDVMLSNKFDGMPENIKLRLRITKCVCNLNGFNIESSLNIWKVKAHFLLSMKDYRYPKVLARLEIFPLNLSWALLWRLQTIQRWNVLFFGCSCQIVANTTAFLKQVSWCQLVLCTYRSSFAY